MYIQIYTDIVFFFSSLFFWVDHVIILRSHFGVWSVSIVLLAANPIFLGLNQQVLFRRLPVWHCRFGTGDG